VEATKRSISFYDKFVELSKGSSPTQSAASYTAVWMLKEAIEKTGTLDSDAIVAALEQITWDAPEGIMKFSTINAPTEFGEVHEPVWGAGGVTGFGIQWQDGKLVTFWPPADGSFRGVVYKGIGNYKLSPKVIEYWKSK
jgi:hypothetical protein